MEVKLPSRVLCPHLKRLIQAAVEVTTEMKDMHGRRLAIYTMTESDAVPVSVKEGKVDKAT